MDSSFGYIRENIAMVRENIRKAAVSSDRNPQDITLLAVSKTFPAGAVEEAFRCGIREFGENYAQEGTEKVDDVKAPARWHFIGHLQKNKVRPVVKKFDVIQSVDSLELLQRIDRIAGEENRKPEILLQINTAGEKSKDGMAPRMAEYVLDGARELLNVRIRGLMLLPPFYDDPNMNIQNFDALVKLAEELDRMSFKNWENRYLSMGMTDDYPLAISRGANLIRVGRAIFGQRRRK